MPSDASACPRNDLYHAGKPDILRTRPRCRRSKSAIFSRREKPRTSSLKLAVKVDRNASADALSTVMDAGASAGFGVLHYAYTSGADSVPPTTNPPLPPHQFLRLLPTHFLIRPMPMALRLLPRPCTRNNSAVSRWAALFLLLPLGGFSVPPWRARLGLDR